MYKLMSSSESSRTSSAWSLALSRLSHKSSRACVELAHVCKFFLSHYRTFRCPISIHTFCIIGILRLNHRNHTLDTCTIPFYHGIWPSWSHRRHICSRPHDAGSVMSCSRLSSPLFVLLCVHCFLALLCFASGPRATAFSRCNVDHVLYLSSGRHQYRSCGFWSTVHNHIMLAWVWVRSAS